MRALAMLALAGLAGCVDLDFMRDQPSVRGQEATPLFRDGRGMQTPPAGTVAREAHAGDPLATRGYVETAGPQVLALDQAYGATVGSTAVQVPRVVEARYAERPPFLVTRAVLERGRRQFEIICATCHGIPGNGVSIPALQMELRPPPSLLDARIRAFPVGRIYRVATEGYGLMEPFGPLLSFEDRWSMAAYVKVLQWSQTRPVGELDPAERARLGP